MKTIVHVTHEALQKVGGIGTVLEGLCTAPAYRNRVDRTLLVAPVFDGDREAADQLGRIGHVLYAGELGVDEGGWAERFRAAEEEFGAGFVYGRRTLREEGTGHENEVEVLLVGVGRMHEHPLAVFKLRLYEQFGIRSDLYDTWDYEQYTRIAPPAIRAMQHLGVEDGDEPATLMAHEYMGMPAALALMLDANRRWRTCFYAHETATVRRIVEKHLGHDTMFYNVMERARREEKSLEDVFGDQSGYYRHPLVAAAHRCDATLAVGDFVREELKFLEPEFARANVKVVYNGIPAHRIDAKEKRRSRGLLRDYAERLTGDRPDWIISHVTRLTLSKGLWRDLKVLWHLEQAARKAGRTAVYFLLSSEIGPPRQPREVREMESRYGWPAAHREGYPDLTGGEAEHYATVQRFNTASRNVKAVFVNQFGWEPSRCGRAMPEGMDFMTLRQGTDLELGQSIYEPFGIAPLEPLAFGGICVPTNICGCAGFLRRLGADDGTPNVVIADYTQLDGAPDSIEALLEVGKRERAAIEETEARRVAGAILERLPEDDGDRERLLESGYALAEHMGWEAIVKRFVLPAVAEADAAP